MAEECHYDPNVIISAAQEKLDQNDLEGGQMIFQSALLEWVDQAREQEHNENYDTLQQAIVALWLAYADFLSSANQYRSAMEVYEQAVNDPVAGSVGTIWLSYAQFAQERDKKRTAQQVYIRALVGTNGGDAGKVQDEQERDILWQAFLEMMQESNPDLTMAELQEVVNIEEQQQKPNAVPSSSVLGGSAADVGGEMEDMPAAVTSSSEPASKRIKLEGGTAASATTAAGAGSSAPPSIPTALQQIHVVSLESVQIEAEAFFSVIQQNEVPQDILAAWMIRDGQGMAQAPEPPLFEPAPPKFSDPTAKDILGVDLALNLNRRLQATSGAVVLKISQVLWTLTALTEQHTTEAITQLDQSLKQAHEQREANFSARIATATTEAVVVAVQANIEQDRQAFQHACQEQRQKLLQDIAWQLRRLLCMQQQVLTKLQVPGFSGPTVDASALQEQAKICSYLHAAFFLRNRIGPEPHLALLDAQAKRLEQQLQAQPELTAPPPPIQQQQQTFPAYALPLPQQQQGAYPPLAFSQPGYGIPPSPPLLPPGIPQYPPYIPQQQQPQHHSRMSQQQLPNNMPPHMMPPQQQRLPRPPYPGQGPPPYNYYPS